MAAKLSSPNEFCSDTSVSDIEEISQSPGRSGEAEPRFCTITRCVVMTVILGLAVTVSSYLIITDSANPLDYFMPADPPGAGAATRWDAMAGLYLQVDNACDGTWADIVDQSILAWNASDAVILTTQRVAYDMDCTPVNGRLKVCNGDYGETDWHGINIMVVDRSTELAVNSISKLNDRYNTNDDERLYTACHENGHGLGLAHTDEDHFNRDRGDCMDYTVNPIRNKVPGDYNLNLLKQLYGTPAQPLGTTSPSYFQPGVVTGDNAAVWSDGQPGASNQWPDEDEKEQENDDKREKDKDGRRLQHRWLEEIHHFEIAVGMECASEYCSFDYDDEYRVEVYKLLAPSRPRA